MKLIEFIEILKGLEKPVFTTADVSKIIGKPPRYAWLYMHRLKRNGRVEEVERGKYALKNTDPMVLATGILFPSYVSFLSGLRFYDLTTQLPRTVFVACSRSRKEIKRDDYGIKFVKLKNSRMFGYKREKYYENKAVIVGEPEKVVVDSLFLPENCPIDEAFGAVMDGEFDTEKLLEYAKRMDSIVVLKRLGYFLERKGIDVYERLKGRLNKRYDLLNPFLPRSGGKNRRWRIIINESLEAG